MCAMSSSAMFQVFIRSSSLLHKSRIFHNSFPRICVASVRQKSDSSKSDLSTSTILVQDGLTVQELPVIVRKVKNIITPFDSKIECATGNYTKYTEAESDVHEMINKEFKQCATIDDVYSLLLKCSTITPNIALGAMERIHDMYEAATKANPGVELDTNSDILERLGNIMVRNDDIYALLRALNVMLNKDDFHVNKFTDEILKRVTDNKLSIIQLCDVVVFFGKHTDVDTFKNSIEKLWIGLAGKEKEFDCKSFVKCFSTLSYLKTSQKFVLGVLERRMFTIWWQLKYEQIIEIMNSLVTNNIAISRILPVLGRWLNTNIHVLTDEILLEIISKFTQLKYSDSQIEKALERYVKVKGLKIELHALMVSIMNHCTLFRIRNPHILNGCAEFFIVNANQLCPMFIKPLLYPFGYLNFHPNNGSKFWETVENVLQDNFLKINMEDIIDLMLSCVYLERYPINFMSNVFNPHFLQKIQSLKNSNVLRSKLKLLDTAMTLECKAFQGPILPKDHSAKSVWQDSRIRRLVNSVRDSFEAVAGDSECLSTSVVLPNIYFTDLYVVDVMIHPKNLNHSILNLNMKKDRNVNVAVLINTPEHFCSNETTLLGPQAMRVKHMRLMGLKVVNLKYDIISKLKMHRKELDRYLVENMKTALPAL